jgi:hypothetical protein
MSEVELLKESREVLKRATAASLNPQSRTDWYRDRDRLLSDIRERLLVLGEWPGAR